MRGGHDLGGVCSHIKAFGFSPFPHQKKVFTDGLLGQHALTMLGRTLYYGNHYYPLCRSVEVNMNPTSGVWCNRMSLIKYFLFSSPTTPPTLQYSMMLGTAQWVTSEIFVYDSLFILCNFKILSGLSLKISYSQIFCLPPPPLLLWVKFLPHEFLSHVNDYIEPMTIFTSWVKITVDRDIFAGKIFRMQIFGVL